MNVNGTSQGCTAVFHYVNDLKIYANNGNTTDVKKKKPYRLESSHLKESGCASFHAERSLKAQGYVALILKPLLHYVVISPAISLLFCTLCRNQHPVLWIPPNLKTTIYLLFSNCKIKLLAQAQGCV